MDFGLELLRELRHLFQLLKCRSGIEHPAGLFYPGRERFGAIGCVYRSPRVNSNHVVCRALGTRQCVPYLLEAGLGTGPTDRIQLLPLDTKILWLDHVIDNFAVSQF